MAEPKKSSDKTKGSARQATAKPKAEVIDGAAVEKPAAAGSVLSSDTAATSKPDINRSTPPPVNNDGVPECGLGDRWNRCCGGVAGAGGICCHPSADRRFGRI